MLAQIRKARQSESGFTLIELLMVIVILGILAGVVVFAVGGITDKGQKSACKADAKTLETAEEAYYAEIGSYTADESLLVPKWLHSAPTTVESSATGQVTAIDPGKCVGLL